MLGVCDLWSRPAHNCCFFIYTLIIIGLPILTLSKGAFFNNYESIVLLFNKFSLFFLYNFVFIFNIQFSLCLCYSVSFLLIVCYWHSDVPVEKFRNSLRDVTEMLVPDKSKDTDK